MYFLSPMEKKVYFSLKKQINERSLCVYIFIFMLIYIFFRKFYFPQDNESGVEFAERVRCAIADKINLKKVDCDGYSIKYNQKKVE